MTRLLRDYGMKSPLLVCVVLLMAMTAATQEPASSSAQPSSRDESTSDSSRKIKGRVTTTSGQPVDGVTVTLVRADAQRSRISVTTDDQGNFLAENIPSGAYAVIASAPGYVMTNQDDAAQNTAVYRPGDFAALTVEKGGVITGRVTDSHGKPLAAVTVRPVQIRDARGSLLASPAFTVERQTDDRGIYRLYGLRPGTYIVSAGGNTQTHLGANPYIYFSPTFYPSSARETAAEVSVKGSSEADDIDIVFRELPGHSITGQLTGSVHNQSFATLYYSGSFITAVTAPIVIKQEDKTFAVTGVADGSYDLVVRSSDPDAGGAVASVPVVIKGSDINGLKADLVEQLTIRGFVTVDQNSVSVDKESGKASARLVMDEVVIRAGPLLDAKNSARQSPMINRPAPVVPAPNGRFGIKPLPPGRFWMMTNLPEGWYVNSIGLGKANGSVKAQESSSGDFELKPGAPADVSIQVSFGAAILEGRVSSKAGVRSKSRIYLVPSDAQFAGDISRYYETTVAGDGSFKVMNVAPGRYLITVIPGIGESDFTEPDVWSPEKRAQIRKNAERQKIEVELHSGRNVRDVVVN